MVRIIAPFFCLSSIFFTALNCFSCFPVFSAGGIAAPYMPLRLILFQHKADFLVAEPVNIFQAFSQILMYCALGDAKARGGGPDSGFVLNDPLRQLTGPLFHIRMQYTPLPMLTWFMYMYASQGLCAEVDPSECSEINHVLLILPIHGILNIIEKLRG